MISVTDYYEILRKSAFGYDRGMHGIFLALSAGIAQSLQGVVSKKLAADAKPRIILIPVFLAAGIFLSPFLFVHDIPALDSTFWIAAVISTSLNAAGAVAFWHALARGEFLRIFPLLSLTPIFSVLTGWLVLGETPALQGFIGIALIVAGLIVLEKRESTASLADKKRRWTALLLGALYALILSINVALDRLAILHSDPYFYAAFFPLATAVPLLLLAAEFPPRKEDIIPLRRHAGLILLAGFFFAASAFFGALGLGYLLASYFSATKRLGILVALVGGVLFFKEKITVRIVVGAAIAVLGVLLIALA